MTAPAPQEPCLSNCDDAPGSPFCTLPRGHEGLHCDEDFGITWEYTERWYYDDQEEDRP